MAVSNLSRVGSSYLVLEETIATRQIEWRSKNELCAN